ARERRSGGGSRAARGGTRDGARDRGRGRGRGGGDQAGDERLRGAERRRGVAACRRVERGVSAVGGPGRSDGGVRRAEGAEVSGGGVSGTRSRSPPPPCLSSGRRAGERDRAARPPQRGGNPPPPP